MYIEYSLSNIKIVPNSVSISRIDLKFSGKKSYLFKQQ